MYQIPLPPAGEGDEMDVVVSENAAVSTAVEGLLAREDDSAGGRAGSLQDTAHRLAEDLAQAISSRVTGIVGEEAGGATPFTGSAGGLLSSLQDLLPSSQQGAGQPRPTTDTPPPPASLSAVLQSLQTTYAPGTDPYLPATTAPPPPFPTIPIETGPLPPPLPDALGPLSPSPEQEPPQEDAPMPGAPEGGQQLTEQIAPPPATDAPLPVAEAPSGSRQPDFSAILGDLDIPEGVDPSFLAALPEDMRAEVIEEQRRLVRARQAPPAPAPAAATPGVVQEVNPEFLAALPPNIQEEVLAQQRLEQQRRTAAQVDPTAPVDPGEFLQTLPPSLRQSLLADMEESQISALPADLAAEAQNLRRDYEQRNSRQTMHERFFSHVSQSGGPTLSSILRSTVNRLGSHYAIHSGSGAGGRSNLWRSVGRAPGGPGGAAVLAAASNSKFRGRQLLDHEGLSCLLILLFIDDAKLNTTRLHRILRNLCYHAPTRSVGKIC